MKTGIVTVENSIVLPQHIENNTVFVDPTSENMKRNLYLTSTPMLWEIIRKSKDIETI